MLTYEAQLDNDVKWALLEGSLYFEQRSAVHATLRRIAQRLDDSKIDYAVAGDLCMFFHGYRRFSQVVELIVTPEALSQLHAELVSPAYICESENPASFRDTENGVEIKCHVSGRHSSKQNPKVVVYPVPQMASTTIDGLKLLDVVPLVELKLALGQAPHRRRDLGDVDELIRYLSLPQHFAAKLQPKWRREFDIAWHNAQFLSAEDY